MTTAAAIHAARAPEPTSANVAERGRRLTAVTRHQRVARPVERDASADRHQQAGRRAQVCRRAERTGQPAGVRVDVDRRADRQLPHGPHAEAQRGHHRGPGERVGRSSSSSCWPAQNSSRNSSHVIRPEVPVGLTEQRGRHVAAEQCAERQCDQQRRPTASRLRRCSGRRPDHSAKPPPPRRRASRWPATSPGPNGARPDGSATTTDPTTSAPNDHEPARTPIHAHRTHSVPDEPPTAVQWMMPAARKCGRVEAQLGGDLVAVLTEHRGRATDAGRRGREPRRRPWLAHGARDRVRALDEDLVVDDLRVGRAVRRAC